MRKLFNSPFINVSLLSFSWALQIYTAKLGFLAGAELFPFTIETAIVVFLFLAFYVLPRKIKEIKKLSISILGWLFLISIINGGLGTILGNIGIQLTSATNAGFLFQFDIAFTIIIAWLFIREKIDIVKIITVCSIVIGTFFLTTKGKFIVPHIGDLFILLASLCYALGTVLLRKMFKKILLDSEIVSLIRAFVSILFLLFFIISYSFYPSYLKQNFKFNIFDFNQIIYVILNSIFTVSLLIFLNKTLKIASASYVAMMAAVTPVIVVILAVIFLKERLEFIQLFGGFLIISSSFATYFLRVDKH